VILAATSEGSESRRRAYALHGQRLAAPPLAPGLHVVSTPIGNLADVTLRALTTLAAADLVVCEDTRVTGRLTSHYGIATSLIAYNDHNAPRMRPQILARLFAGEAVALVSDAGTPMVSDPGYKLVREAIEAGIAVYSAPGASAALAALTVAGLPTDRFFFEGFLPAKAGARANRLDALKKVPATLVFFESGPRLAVSLAAMASVLGERPATVARELTKTFETIYRGSLASLAAQFAEAGAPKGEIVVVVGPPAEEKVSATQLETFLEAALATLSVKDAAQSVSVRLGLPRRDVYARAVEMATARRARIG
jgi:16S rRNA (cytidine1402-2'-O)-methyltransferase